MTKQRGRLCLYLATLAAVFFLNGQTAQVPANPCFDENQVRLAMREEALRLLVNKTVAARRGAAGIFDFHIEEAYAMINKRLPPAPLAQAELTACLRQMLENPAPGEEERNFQNSNALFVAGMAMEIINTLQEEYDQVAELVVRLDSLKEELLRTPRPGRDTFERGLRKFRIDKRLYRAIQTIDVRWKLPAAGADSFSVFNIFRKNMIGRKLAVEQKLVFELGERYRSPFPFLDGFMDCYRRLAGEFRRAARELNDITPDGNP